GRWRAGAFDQDRAGAQRQLSTARLAAALAGSPEQLCAVWEWELSAFAVISRRLADAPVLSDRAWRGGGCLHYGSEVLLRRQSRSPKSDGAYRRRHPVGGLYRLRCGPNDRKWRVKQARA